MSDAFTVRRADEADAFGILKVLEIVAAERIFSAIDRPWGIEQERSYLRCLSSREATQVAVRDSGEIIGYQNLDLWAAPVRSMRHVGQIGTFLLPAWRRRGVGHALFQATRDFATAMEYSKFVIQVRASNTSAQEFYKSLEFRECGRFARQVRIDDQEDDEIMMEYFL
jgi:ribosomal-protein-alanine N-acetyltransferase